MQTETAYRELPAARDLKFRLHRPAMEQLQALADDGLRSVPKRGAEIGGVLISRSPAPDGLIAIDGVVAVPCGYDTGPSYRLSAEDAIRLDETLAAIRSDGEARVIGYFRSHTRGALELLEDDRRVMRQFFPASDSIVLLIRPVLDEIATASIYYRDREQWRLSASFPLLDAGAEPVCAPKLPEPAETSPVPVVAQRRRPERRMRAPGWKWPALLLVIAAGAVAGRLDWKSHLLRQKPEGVGLKLEKQGGDLRLTWDRQRQAVLQAAGAVLVIRDGQAQKEYELDPGQLRTGSVVYTAASGDVMFHMQLRGGAAEEETLRVLLPDRPAMPVFSENAPSTLVPAPPRQVRPTVQAGRAVAAQPARVLALPVSVGPQTAMLDEQEIPALKVAPASDNTLPLAVPKVPQPAAPGPRATQPAAPAPQPTPVYIAPEPLRRVPAVLPVNVRSMVTGTLTVPVRVEIDAKGQVTKATPLEARTGLQQLLSTHAVNAALRWQFAPARRGNQNVASDAILNFRFSGNGR